MMVLSRPGSPGKDTVLINTVNAASDCMSLSHTLHTVTLHSTMRTLLFKNTKSNK